MERPFIAYKIGELEEAFSERSEDQQFLELLKIELSHRSTPRATKLMTKVQSSLMASSAKPSNPRQSSADAGDSTLQPNKITPLDAPFSLVLPGTPLAVLDAWTALEVLSPQSFRRPEDLTGGDKKAIAWLDQGKLPWDGNVERSRKNYRLYYQIVLGSLRLEETVRNILDVFTDKRIERPTARGSAALAVVIVDRHGLPVDEPSVALSSFAWGVPHALANRLDMLAAWPSAEQQLVKGLEKEIRRTDQDGNLLPLSWTLLSRAYEWLTEKVGLPAKLTEAPRFAIRSFQYFKNQEPPEPVLLNSFFLGDLARARAAFQAGNDPPNLRRYLGVDGPSTRRDLLRDDEALENAVSPASTPPSRWPGKGRHPLVLLQQAAVNSAFATLKEDGILAVNGPPGTGKTTLLRDLVAALVSARAEIMVRFDDPLKAFVHSGERIKAGQAWLHLYRLDPSLKGFEILVASSNNKAVENVSAELPGLDALAQDEQLRYFSGLADALNHPKKTWGLIAAVLGNSANRSKFRQTFWWDDDVGLSTYLAAAAGTAQAVEEKDPETGETVKRPPRIVAEEHPPANHAEALVRWHRARNLFSKTLAKSRHQLLELEKVRQAIRKLPDVAKRKATAAEFLVAAKDAVSFAETNRIRADSEYLTASKALSESQQQITTHNRSRPGFFARLLRLTSARQWKILREQLEVAKHGAQKALDSAQREKEATEATYWSQSAIWRQAEQNSKTVCTEHATLCTILAQARARLGNKIVDSNFFQLSHAEFHQVSPWLDELTQRTRDDVFVASMKLHKAFIDVAAKPIRHNLGNLMNVFSGKSMPDQAKADLVPDLWASLFLVVPLLSTTFASTERMLGSLPPQSLGWLLVDEAGQALPQAAVGALMRTRRAVVVGDPLQIEPVIVLPDTLTRAICRQFGADPDRFNAPEASVQTLADAATPFMAEFNSRQGSREVGVPLLVHRRCAEPMFGVSNAIAYSGLMVPAKRPARSCIRDVLGSSAWIDVQGGGADKWSPEEGREVLALLRRLVDAGVGFENCKGPDVYLITPFVIVADNLRSLIQKERLAENWGGDSWSWSRERVGTVHTVQGREAEAVLLVLGAATATQAGARNWAGGKPNLLNVAVTRAKEELYVVGDRELWRKAGVFQKLDERLPS